MVILPPEATGAAPLVTLALPRVIRILVMHPGHLQMEELETVLSACHMLHSVSLLVTLVMF